MCKSQTYNIDRFLIINQRKNLLRGCIMAQTLLRPEITSRFVPVDVCKSPSQKHPTRPSFLCSARIVHSSLESFLDCSGGEPRTICCPHEGQVKRHGFAIFVNIRRLQGRKLGLEAQNSKSGTACYARSELGSFGKEGAGCETGSNGGPERSGQIRSGALFSDQMEGGNSEGSSPDRPPSINGGASAEQDSREDITDSGNSISSEPEIRESDPEPLERSWKTLFAGADDDLLGPNHPLASEPVLIDRQPIKILGDEFGGWCSLCGFRRGWAQCGACDGTGGYATKPGKAGVSNRVGWARCKTCYGRTVVPCQLCGIPDPAKWHQWLEHARRWPRKAPPGRAPKGRPEGKQLEEGEGKKAREV